MKSIPVFLFCAAAAFAQNFATGQAARAVIGQETFNSQDTNSSNTVIGAASGIAYAADTLFVADSNGIGASPSNNRVLLFTNLSSQLPAPTAQLPYNSKCPVCVGQATVVLGQPDFVTTTVNTTTTASSLRNPQAVASDGVHLVIADTDHNRVLIWNHIPTSNNQPADVVIGQPNFTTTAITGNTPSAQSMRGPQGVWIQSGKLFVADTQNNRVLIFNQIPTTSGVAANVVLGAPNFTTYVNPDISQQQNGATASTMFSPVSVTSDGTRLFVSDLGFNRVLIFNTIPTTNGAAADVALGQPDLVSSVANNAYTGTAATSSTDTTDKETPVLCTQTNGVDLYGNPTYPFYCNATMNFPRFAMAVDGQLMVADGGNDRILVWQTIPTTSGSLANTIIGQIGGDVNQASDAADSLRTPSSLAWDGTNLFVSDTYNRRITVYTIGNVAVGYQGVVNAASLDVTATGSLTVSGSIQAGDYITVYINNAMYNYMVESTDTLLTVTQGIISAINSSNNGAGDPNLVATFEENLSNTADFVILLTAKMPGNIANDVTYSATFTPATGIAAAEIAVTAADSQLEGGGDAANVAPGTVVSILANAGTTLSAGTASWNGTQSQLPLELAGTQVYFNGIQAPLFYVSPTQINAQVPWEVGDQTSVNAFVLSAMPNGSMMFTSAVAVTIVPANPGIYFQAGTSNPQVGLVYHSSSNATAIVSIDGGVAPGAVATIGVNGRNYSYTSTAIDTLDSVRNALALQLNTDPQVSASVAGVFDRIILKARVAGPEGNGIPITGTASGGSLVVTVFDQQTCCGNIAGMPVTDTNPALPGELVTLYATGLGVPNLTDAVQSLVQTGVTYPLTGPITQPNPANFVSATAGGSTADVLQATMQPGTAGGFVILLHLNPGLVTSQYTLVDIAQNQFVSNEVAFPLVNPNNITSQDPELVIVSQHIGNFTPGQQDANYTLTVTNTGSGQGTTGMVTVTETLPTGLTLVQMVGDGWTCSGNVCTRSDTLSAGLSWPTITVIVNVASNAPSSVTNTVKITGGGSASSTSNDVTLVSGTTPSNPPHLTATFKANGTFTQGEAAATYTVTVSNAHGAGSTSGIVTVSEAFPVGLSLVSLVGTNWTCIVDTCTRTDGLGGGDSYPPITVTVSVASNAPSSVVNTVIVSGGGSAASVSTETTTINQ
jgi:uncharacterized protein (TIGR03437 family)